MHNPASISHYWISAVLLPCEICLCTHTHPPIQPPYYCMDISLKATGHFHHQAQFSSFVSVFFSLLLPGRTVCSLWTFLPFSPESPDFLFSFFFFKQKVFFNWHTVVLQYCYFRGTAHWFSYTYIHTYTYMWIYKTFYSPTCYYRILNVVSWVEFPLGPYWLSVLYIVV